MARLIPTDFRLELHAWKALDPLEVDPREPILPHGFAIDAMVERVEVPSGPGIVRSMGRATEIQSSHSSGAARPGGKYDPWDLPHIHGDSGKSASQRRKRIEPVEFRFHYHFTNAGAVPVSFTRVVLAIHRQQGGTFHMVETSEKRETGREEVRRIDAGKSHKGTFGTCNHTAEILGPVDFPQRLQIEFAVMRGDRAVIGPFRGPLPPFGLLPRIDPDPFPSLEAKECPPGARSLFQIDPSRN